MVQIHFLVAALCFASVHSRYVYIEDTPQLYLTDIYAEDNLEPSHVRVARQTSLSLNADGSKNVGINVPLAENDKNALIGSMSGSGIKKNGEYDSASVGLSLANVNGHSISLSETHKPNAGDLLKAAGRVNIINTPDHKMNANAFASKAIPNVGNAPTVNSYGGSLDYTFKDRHGLDLSATHNSLSGDQLTAAGKFNLFKNNDHKLDANAFITRNIPNTPVLPSYNTQGGSLDYMFRDKVGASVGMSHTPLFDKTDYSAGGKFNLFKDRTSSLDLNAGMSRSISPYNPSSNWQPFGGVSYTKWW